MCVTWTGRLVAAVPTTSALEPPPPRSVSRFGAPLRPELCGVGGAAARVRGVTRGISVWALARRRPGQPLPLAATAPLQRGEEVGGPGGDTPAPRQLTATPWTGVRKPGPFASPSTAPTPPPSPTPVLSAYPRPPRGFSTPPRPPLPPASALTSLSAARPLRALPPPTFPPFRPHTPFFAPVFTSAPEAHLPLSPDPVAVSVATSYRGFCGSDVARAASACYPPYSSLPRPLRSAHGRAPLALVFLSNFCFGGQRLAGLAWVQHTLAALPPSWCGSGGGGGGSVGGVCAERWLWRCLADK